MSPYALEHGEQDALKIIFVRPPQIKLLPSEENWSWSMKRPDTS